MLTREEYKKTVERIFDNIRKDKNKGVKGSCDMSMSCEGCLFNGEHIFCLSVRGIDNIFNAFEYVEKWAKDHPLVTYEQKYKETFGVEPKKQCGAFVCPRSVGFADVVSCNPNSCERCKREFWHSEYKEPKRENKE